MFQYDLSRANSKSVLDIKKKTAFSWLYCWSLIAFLLSGIQQRYILDYGQNQRGCLLIPALVLLDMGGFYFTLFIAGVHSNLWHSHSPVSMVVVCAIVFKILLHRALCPACLLPIKRRYFSFITFFLYCHLVRPSFLYSQSSSLVQGYNLSLARIASFFSQPSGALA